MGEICTTLSNKRDVKILNYELVKGEDVTWKPK